VVTGNGEIVRRWCCWLEAPSARRDVVRATLGELWDVQGDYYPVRKFPEAHPCHGLDEIVDFTVRFVETWSDITFPIRRVIEVGDDRVLASATMRASARGSSLKLEDDIYFCAWLRNGRLLRVEDHTSLQGALRALGLQGATLEAAGLIGGQP